MPQQKLENKSNRHKKLIGTIEKCLLLYREKNVDVVSIEQIRGWINDNYRNGISKRRLSVFLYRRPQFKLQKKCRWKNSNTFETWWSLGDLEKEPEIDKHPHWIDVPIVEEDE